MSFERGGGSVSQTFSKGGGQFLAPRGRGMIFSSRGRGFPLTPLLSMYDKNALLFKAMASHSARTTFWVNSGLSMTKKRKDKQNGIRHGLGGHGTHCWSWSPHVRHSWGICLSGALPNWHVWLAHPHQ